MPRPQAKVYGHTVHYSTATCEPPPPASSNYIVEQLENSSPRILRSSLYNIPQTPEMLKGSGLHLAMSFQPFPLQPSEEMPVPVADLGEEVAVRCTKCMAYMNPFMKFIDRGNQFICNLCGHTNKTPYHYMCTLGADGRRRDAQERPELSRGTVEFPASKSGPALASPAYFFLIDVTHAARKSGATAASCCAIQSILSDFPYASRTLVGLATFDSTIHFYNISNKLRRPQMIVVDTSCYIPGHPLRSGLLAPVSEGVEHMSTVLSLIPSMFVDDTETSSAMGPAIKASSLVLEGTGGKLMVFQTTLPTIGVNALPAETESEDGMKQKLMVNMTLKRTAQELLQKSVCMDLFVLASQSTTGISSLSTLPKATGGQLYHYSPFGKADLTKLYNDLRWNILRPQGLHAIMIMRCCLGLEVQEYIGFGYEVQDQVGRHHMKLSAIDSDKAMLVTFKYSSKLQDYVSFQYTTMDGQRRVRVSNLCLPCTGNMREVFDCADVDTQVACMMKTDVEALQTTPLEALQSLKNCVDMLYTYKMKCWSREYLPERLKLLPLAWLKSPAFQEGVEIDTRNIGSLE